MSNLIYGESSDFIVKVFDNGRKFWITVESLSYTSLLQFT